MDIDIEKQAQLDRASEYMWNRWGEYGREAEESTPEQIELQRILDKEITKEIDAEILREMREIVNNHES